MPRTSDPPLAAAARLRALLAAARRDRRCEPMPACHDALSAALVQRAGFSVCFMSGFAVSAAHLALPDAGLISYGEQLEVGRRACEAAPELCIIGDGDTGFGSAANVRRTIEGYARAGFAGISIEDQRYPKRCAYARGVAVEARDAAVARLRAAVAARDELRARAGLDLVIVGRTDCRHAAEDGGAAEALARCRAFADAGADVVYAEGLAHDELAALGKAVPHVPTMLAQVEGAGAPWLSTADAAALGCSLCLTGLTLLSASVAAMKGALARMAAGGHPPAEALMPLAELHAEVGFEEHYAWEARFSALGPNAD